MKVDLSVRKLGDDAVEIRVMGRLEGTGAMQALEEQLSQALVEGRHMLLNLKRCTGVDDAIVGLLAVMDRRFDEDGALDLLVFGASDPILRQLHFGAEL